MKGKRAGGREEYHNEIGEKGRGEEWFGSEIKKIRRGLKKERGREVKCK